MIDLEFNGKNYRIDNREIEYLISDMLCEIKSQQNIIQELKSTPEELIFYKITSNGNREMTLERFLQALEEWKKTPRK